MYDSFGVILTLAENMIRNDDEFVGKKRKQYEKQNGLLKKRDFVFNRLQEQVKSYLAKKKLNDRSNIKKTKEYLKVNAVMEHMLKPSGINEVNFNTTGGSTTKSNSSTAQSVINSAGEHITTLYEEQAFGEEGVYL